MNPEELKEIQLKLLLLLSAIIKIVVVDKKNKIIKKKKWSRNWLKRREEGKCVLNLLNEELRVEDPISYKNFVRLTEVQFEYILNLLSNLQKIDTFMRNAISVKDKLNVTLRFLATGETYRSLMYSCRIHESTISRFVPEVCKTIVQKLGKLVLKTPNTVEEWKRIATDFDHLWQFPHALGALDGRHIVFRAPISDGSYFYNYKGDHSIVLLALIDAHYKFIYVNIGVNGRISDGGVFQQSLLSRAFISNELNFPPAEPLPSTNINTPYVIIADDAFPLSDHLMKPYSQRGLDHDCQIFNYRLSRARRIVENAFGILANRFRILLNPINLSVHKVQLITLTCIILHNYLATENGKNYTDITNETVQNLTSIGQQGGNYSSTDSRKIRDSFKKYFLSPIGQVEWQENAIIKHNM